MTKTYTAAAANHQYSLVVGSNDIDIEGNDLTSIDDDDDHEVLLVEDAEEEQDAEEQDHSNNNTIIDSFFTYKEWEGGPEILRYLRFLLISILGIVYIHQVVRWMNWEHDTDLTLRDLVLYDGHAIVADTVLFFIIGRLYKENTSWLWTAVAMFISPTYVSWSYTLSFLQHSLTLYEMHCEWPWELWIFCGVMIVLGLYIGVQHLLYYLQQPRVVLLQKFSEILCTLFFFLAPIAQNPSFHLHHWFAGWLLGMHCTIHDKWWSSLTMAWCWGLYINGIGVYGRDPLLTCADAYYRSTNQRCSYMECYYQEDDNTNTTNHTNYKPYIPPDWRNCTAR